MTARGRTRRYGPYKGADGYERYTTVSPSGHRSSKGAHQVEAEKKAGRKAKKGEHAAHPDDKKSHNKGAVLQSSKKNVSDNNKKRAGRSKDSPNVDNRKSRAKPASQHKKSGRPRTKGKGKTPDQSFRRK